MSDSNVQVEVNGTASPQLHAENCDAPLGVSEHQRARLYAALAGTGGAHLENSAQKSKDTAVAPATHRKTLDAIPRHDVWSSDSNDPSDGGSATGEGDARADTSKDAPQTAKKSQAGGQKPNLLTLIADRHSAAADAAKGGARQKGKDNEEEEDEEGGGGGGGAPAPITATFYEEEDDDACTSAQSRAARSPVDLNHNTGGAHTNQGHQQHQHALTPGDKDASKREGVQQFKLPAKDLEDNTLQHQIGLKNADVQYSQSSTLVASAAGSAATLAATTATTISASMSVPLVAAPPTMSHASSIALEGEVAPSQQQQQPAAAAISDVPTALQNEHECAADAMQQENVAQEMHTLNDDNERGGDDVRVNIDVEDVEDAQQQVPVMHHVEALYQQSPSELFEKVKYPTFSGNGAGGNERARRTKRGLSKAAAHRAGVDHNGECGVNDYGIGARGRIGSRKSNGKKLKNGAKNHADDSRIDEELNGEHEERNIGEVNDDEEEEEEEEQDEEGVDAENEDGDEDDIDESEGGSSSDEYEAIMQGRASISGELVRGSLFSGGADRAAEQDAAQEDVQNKDASANQNAEDNAQRVHVVRHIPLKRYFYRPPPEEILADVAAVAAQAGSGEAPTPTNEHYALRRRTSKIQKWKESFDLSQKRRRKKRLQGRGGEDAGNDSASDQGVDDDSDMQNHNYNNAYGYHHGSMKNGHNQQQQQQVPVPAYLRCDGLCACGYLANDLYHDYDNESADFYADFKPRESQYPVQHVLWYVSRWKLNKFVITHAQDRSQHDQFVEWCMWIEKAAYLGFQLVQYAREPFQLLRNFVLNEQQRYERLRQSLLYSDMRDAHPIDYEQLYYALCYMCGARSPRAVSPPKVDLLLPPPQPSSQPSPSLTPTPTQTPVPTPQHRHNKAAHHHHHQHHHHHTPMRKKQTSSTIVAHSPRVHKERHTHLLNLDKNNDLSSSEMKRKRGRPRKHKSSGDFN